MGVQLEQGAGRLCPRAVRLDFADKI